ncbi:MAG: flavin reductase family protein [Elusimicrobiota bacterium]|jgi:flavin reductase (DIM6/NTAB) family NADH-FMN oxidoreductase RutF|nr:flavin reductase family protein [Elusimicrobiota bacterium]
MKKFPLHKAFTFLEPGPVLLIGTRDKGKNNIMTLSWSMVMDFTPQFAFLTGPWNFSYAALTKTKECVISVPTVEMAQTVVKIGDCCGADTDKFKKFNLTPLAAQNVKAPLIKECLANIECRVTDHIKKHNIFVLEALAAWYEPRHKEKRTIHAVGDGTFITDGHKINLRKFMADKLPPGV